MVNKGNRRPVHRSANERRRTWREEQRIKAIESVGGLCPYCGEVPDRWQYKPITCCASCAKYIRNGHRELYELVAFPKNCNVAGLAKKLRISRQYLYRLRREGIRFGANLRTKLQSEKCHTIFVWPKTPVKLSKNDDTETK